MRRLFFACIVLPVVGLVVAPAARGLDREDMSVSRAEPKVNKTYTEPILASNTSLLHRPSDCRTAAYCDVVDLHIDVGDFAEDDLYYIDFVLSWPQEYNEDSGAQSNDLDLYLYDSTELRIGQAATANETEETRIDLPLSGVYYLVINNFAGPNLGYTFDITLTYAGKQKAIPDFIRATPRPSAPPAAQERPTPSFTPAPETDLESGATLAPVITPGPDGEPTTLSLEAVQTASQVEDGGPSWWAMLLVVLLAAGILGGGGFLVYRRVRRAQP